MIEADAQKATWPAALVEDMVVSSSTASSWTRSPGRKGHRSGQFPDPQSRTITTGSRKLSRLVGRGVRSPTPSRRTTPRRHPPAGTQGCADRRVKRVRAPHGARSRRRPRQDHRERQRQVDRHTRTGRSDRRETDQRRFARRSWPARTHGPRVRPAGSVLECNSATAPLRADPSFESTLRIGEGKFGSNVRSGQALETIEAIVNSTSLDFLGLHHHVGFSGYMGDYTPEREVMITASSPGEICAFANTVRRRLGVSVQRLDMGGGFRGGGSMLLSTPGAAGDLAVYPLLPNPITRMPSFPRSKSGSKWMSHPFCSSNPGAG